VYERYCAQLERYGVLDYDDILLNALKLFEDEDAGSLEGKNRRNSFSHLLVDEFQDINMIQYRLIQAWGRDSTSIFIIGDPDQSIYGFRGSDSRCFARFFADFPGRSKSGSPKITARHRRSFVAPNQSSRRKLRRV
jgi:superfamily I DNA/RNA helicase